MGPQWRFLLALCFTWGLLLPSQVQVGLSRDLNWPLELLQLPWQSCLLRGLRLQVPLLTPAVAAAHEFTASTEWKDMQAWRAQMTKDQDETKRTVGNLAEAQSKMAGDIASGRAENSTSFDALLKMMATMQSAIQGNHQR